MKKLLLTAIAGSALAFPLFVQAQNAYVELGVGQANYDFEERGLQVISRDDKPTAWKIAAGYNFTPNFGAEIGYADLGSEKNLYSINGTNLGAELNTNSTYLAGTATAPISDNFTIFGKLGASWNHTDGDFVLSDGTRASGSASKTGLLANIGVGYKFNDNFSASLQYDSFGDIGEADANDSTARMWEIAGRYSF